MSVGSLAKQVVKELNLFHKLFGYKQLSEDLINDVAIKCANLRTGSSGFQTVQLIP